ncbi:hypothetical protein IAR55_004004 [Kwoniella newhampshirensis]|uniref:Uncharacterized protein n=1 Tax=Kwoniella newhampshirensis TaxID=1651941 RepID=A0AAW0YW72_9TREE
MSRTTLDDTSRYFQFGGDVWSTDHHNDPLTPQYYNQTFHATTLYQAYARICWSGTDITLYGGKRANHGTYATIIDNGSPIFANGYSGPAEIPSVLYASQGLSQGSHLLVIMNEGKLDGQAGVSYWLDVDYVEFDGDAIDCSSLPDPTVTPTAITTPASVGATTTQGAAAPADPVTPTSSPDPATPTAAAVNTSPDTPTPVPGPAPQTSSPVVAAESGDLTGSGSSSTFTQTTAAIALSGNPSSTILGTSSVGSLSIASSAAATNVSIGLIKSSATADSATLGAPHISINVPVTTPGMAVAGVKTGNGGMRNMMMEGNVLSLAIMIWTWLLFRNTI